MRSQSSIRLLMLIGCSLTAVVAILSWTAYHDLSMVIRDCAPAVVAMFLACFFLSRLKRKEKQNPDP